MALLFAISCTLILLIVELASIIITMLNDANSFSRSLSPLVDDCRVLLSRISHHKVQHCDES